MQEKRNERRDLKALAALFEPKLKTVTQNLAKKFDQVEEPQNRVDSKMAADWKRLINEKFMSDLIIYTKNERPVYAHKLVFHARCRSILSETIKEERSGKCTEILMWLEYGHESVLAILEYIYTGRAPDTKKLNENQIKDLKSICSRYGYVELKDSIERVTAKDDMFEPEETCRSGNAKENAFEPEDTRRSAGAEENLFEPEETCRSENSKEDAFEPEESFRAGTGLEEPAGFRESFNPPDNKSRDEQNLFHEEESRTSATVSSPEMFCRELSPVPYESEVDSEIRPKFEFKNDRTDIFDDLVRRSLTPRKEGTNERSRDVRNSAEKHSTSETESVASNRSRTIIDDILSDLCSPPRSKADSKELLGRNDDFKSGNAAFDNVGELEKYGLSQTVLRDCLHEDVICLSSDDDGRDDILTQREIAASRLSSQIRCEPAACYSKRKSVSPLQKSTAKKTKRRSRNGDGGAASSNDDQLPGERPKRPKSSKKSKKRKSTLSQSLILSPSDSDASLYKLDTTSVSSDSDAERRGCSAGPANGWNPETSHSSYLQDDFQDLLLEDRICDGFLEEYTRCSQKMNKDPKSKDSPNKKSKQKSTAKNTPNKEPKLKSTAPNESPYVSPVWNGFDDQGAVNTQFKQKDFANKDSKLNNTPNKESDLKDTAPYESPYISPVWDGFEDANDQYFGMEFSPNLNPPANTLLSLKATSSPNVSANICLVSDTECNASATSSHHSYSKEPSFGSFSVDESLLNRIESSHRAEVPKTQEVPVTATEVRKLKRRSKSDTSVATNSRKRKGIGTCPDYQNMNSPELKVSKKSVLWFE